MLLATLVYYFILYYIRRAILIQKRKKSGLREKKTCHFNDPNYQITCLCSRPRVNCKRSPSLCTSRVESRAQSPATSARSWPSSWLFPSRPLRSARRARVYWSPTALSRAWRSFRLPSSSWRTCSRRRRGWTCSSWRPTCFARLCQPARRLSWLTWRPRGPRCR